jgi:hypothetical protein
MLEYGYICRFGDRTLFHYEKLATVPELAHFSKWIGLFSSVQGVIADNISECVHKGTFSLTHDPEIY